jgi:hypothetical protein
MNLKNYPLSNRFIEDVAFLNETNLEEVQEEFTSRNVPTPNEKGKLTRARNSQDGDGFYSTEPRSSLCHASFKQASPPFSIPIVHQ